MFVWFIKTEHLPRCIWGCPFQNLCWCFFMHGSEYMIYLPLKAGRVRLSRQPLASKWLLFVENRLFSTNHLFLVLGLRFCNKLFAGSLTVLGTFWLPLGLSGQEEGLGMLTPLCLFYLFYEPVVEEQQAWLDWLVWHFYMEVILGSDIRVEDPSTTSRTWIFADGKCLLVSAFKS